MTMNVTPHTLPFTVLLRVRSCLLCLLSLLVLGAFAFAQSPPSPVTPAVSWKQLPAIPDPEGVAGAFAGVSHRALVVAGGANFRGDKWKEPAAKSWNDSAYVLEQPDGAWKSGFKLPRPLGYGVSITAGDAVLCLGGGDATRHYAECFRLEWADGRLRTTELPPLPRPCANACGALVGRTVYLAGGLESPAATTALHTFWALDLDAAPLAWREVEPWPGPERMLAVAGEYDGAFYLFSGTKLSAAPDGQAARECLRDAYRFTPGEGWKRLADLPRSAVAAPSPARLFGGLGFLIVCGDDGLHLNFQPVEKHPGFPRTALAYDPAADAWRAAGAIPFSRATVPAVWWRDRLVIPSGEVRPRVRTPEVWSLQVAAP
jgi:N-acetylneuraminate epimerase